MALVNAASTAALTAMGLDVAQMTALGALLEGLAKDSPINQLLETAVTGAFSNGTPTLEALTATMKTTFTSAAFSTLLESTDGVDANLLAALSTASENGEDTPPCTKGEPNCIQEWIHPGSSDGTCTHNEDIPVIEILLHADGNCNKLDLDGSYYEIRCGSGGVGSGKSGCDSDDCSNCLHTHTGVKFDMTCQTFPGPDGTFFDAELGGNCADTTNNGGCPSMCLSDEAAECDKECTPCLTNFDGTTGSGKACSTCASCAVYAACASCDREEALYQGALTAAMTALGMTADEITAFATMVDSLPENSPLEKMVADAVSAAFGETAPSIQALTATMKTVFTSAEFRTELKDTDGIDADLLAAVSTASENAVVSGAAGLALSLAVVAMAAAALL
jgi:hypothetical protein